jgi:poly-D-alanine transfer protein DltD
MFAFMREKIFWTILLCFLMIFILSSAVIALHEKDEDDLWTYLPREGDKHKYCVFTKNKLSEASGENDENEFVLNVTYEAIASKGDEENKINMEYHIYAKFLESPSFYTTELEVKTDRIVVNDRIMGEQIFIKKPVKVNGRWRTSYLGIKADGRSVPLLKNVR